MLFLALLLIWIVLNGRITLEIFLFGVAISFLLCLFSVKAIGYDISGEKRTLREGWGFVRFFFCLFVEICKANWQVIRMILRPKMKTEPVLAFFKVTLPTETKQVFLANAITLTPGTITLRLRDGNYCVHALDRSLIDGINQSVFVERLEKIGDTKA